MGVASALPMLGHELGAGVEGAVRGRLGRVDVVTLRAGLAEGLGERGGVGVVAGGVLAAPQLPLVAGWAGAPVRGTHVPLVTSRVTRRERVPHLPLAVGLGVELAHLPLAVGRGKLVAHLLELQGRGRGLGPGLHKLLVEGRGRGLPRGVKGSGLGAGVQVRPGGQHGLNRHASAGLKLLLLLLLEAGLLVVRGRRGRGREVVEGILGRSVTPGAVVLRARNMSLRRRARLGRVAPHGRGPAAVLLLFRTILCSASKQKSVNGSPQDNKQFLSHIAPNQHHKSPCSETSQKVTSRTEHGNLHTSLENPVRKVHVLS